MTRLSDAQMRAAAGATTWPAFEAGDRVRVHFSVQDPIDGVILAPPDRQGWVKVAATFEMGTYDFLALAAACVVEDDAP